MEKTAKISAFTSCLGGLFARDLDGSRAAECVNFRSEKGILKDGQDLFYYNVDGKRLSVPDGVEPLKIFCATFEVGERLILAAKKDGITSLYEADASTPEKGFTAIGNTELGGVPFFTNADIVGNRMLIALDSSGKFYTYNGSAVTPYTCPKDGVAILPFDNRLALVTTRQIFMSAPAAVTSFTEYGSSAVSLPPTFTAGAAVQYGSELMVAGMRGLIRFAKNPNGTLAIKTISTGGEKLYCNTLAVGEEKVSVLSDAGLCEYDGLELKFSHPEIGELIGDGRCGFIWGREYTAAVSPASAPKRTLVFTFNSDSYAVSDMPILSIGVPFATDGPLVLSSETKYICSFRGLSAKTNVRRTYTTARTDFGVAGKKTLTGISVYSNRNISVIVDADGHRHMFRLSGGRPRKFTRMYIRGEIFSFTFVAEGSGVEISYPQFYFDTGSQT